MLASRHGIVAGVLIAVVTFVVYLSNGQWNGSYDSAPNTVLAFSIFERGRLDLDEFRNSYFTGLGGQYAFTETANGHLAPVFPVGAAMLAAPVYAVLFATDRARSELPNITSPAFEPERRFDERIVAAFLAAISVALFFYCAMRLGTPLQACIATFVYAFATSIWTIGSQALWQHGPVNLCLLVTIYGIVRSARDDRFSIVWTVAAGLAAGFLPVVRPTAVVFTIAAIAFTFLYRRKTAPVFCAAAAAGLLPGIMWNGYFFHSLLGGYALNAAHYSSNAAAAVRGFSGLLLSPSRGFLIYTPVALFSILGAIRAYRSAENNARLLGFMGIACVALVLNYSFFTTWWGGFTYGPRFLTDCDAVAALALVFVLPRSTRDLRTPSMVALAALVIWSIGVQAAGAYSGAAGADWNAIPVSVDAQPERLWSIADNQIERNVRAFYYKTFAWNVASTPLYVRRFRASVHTAGRASDPAAVVVENTGSVPLYGYDSGVYAGQLRVRGRNGETLYLRGTLLPGQSGIAIGSTSGPVRASDLTPVLVNVAK